jgi:hypothetical protein
LWWLCGGLEGGEGGAEGGWGGGEVVRGGGMGDGDGLVFSVEACVLEWWMRAGKMSRAGWWGDGLLSGSHCMGQALCRVCRQERVQEYQ